MKSSVIKIVAVIIFSVAFLANAIKNDLYNIYSSAKKYYSNRDYEKAYSRFREYIDSTEYTPQQNWDRLGDAYFNIGHFYKCGHYLQCDIDSAINYLNIATFAYSNSDAARMLHSIYYYKQYSHIDKPMSFQMLKHAADLGDIKSNLEIGNIYLSGKSAVLKDTTIYTYNTRIRHNGDTIMERGYWIGLTPTKSTIRFNDIERDSTLGYYYYERGINVNRPLVNSKYTLQDIDFIRAYMDGKYLTRDYEAAWEYLRQYLDNTDDYILEQGIELPESYFKDYGEIYWRIQTAYRFGLGTRINLIQADYYLKKSAIFGYEPAIIAISYLQ